MRQVHSGFCYNVGMEPLTDLRTCAKCYDSKPLSEYSPGQRKGNGKCRKCMRLKDGKERHRYNTYGLWSSNYEALLESQGGVCAICGEPPTVVDHDHKTGKVRGLLCSGCNLALGHMKDNAGALRAAADYLDRAVDSSNNPG